MKKITFLVIALLFFSFLGAQISWTNKNLFEQKNFIENNGQFDLVKIPNGETILFTAKIDGVSYYFTKTGYTIGRTTSLEKDKNEQDEVLKKGESDDKEKENNFKMIENYHELAFLQANQEVEVIAANKVSNYYSYSDLKSKDNKKTIIANAFTKIIYKNIYPNTDIVFTFPKDSTGIEYSIYLHPGSDLKAVKIGFPLETSENKTTKRDKITFVNNAIEINSIFGKIIHYSPHTFVAENKSVLKSRYLISDNTIGFAIKNQPKDKTIIIDPWTITPNFAGTNAAYDVDYDNIGNVYVYGGISPFVLMKLSSTGLLQWSYTSFSSTASLFPIYGDFAVDRNSESSYLIEGFNSVNGSGVVKLDGNGLQSAIFNGNSNFSEMWRIAYSRCTNEAVIAGGGITNPTFQTCYLDTNLTNLSPVTYVAGGNPYHDVSALALDNFGNCYQLTNQGNPDQIMWNQLVKLPLPSLIPITYNVASNYNLIEGNSNLFYGGFGVNPIGYNGMTTTQHIVYTYDSYVLKKWDGPTGNLLAYKRISFPANNDSSVLNWSGISADECGNLFLGDNSTVRQYDASLNLVNSYLMPSAIYDLNISNNGTLYVCGNGFVSSVTPSGLISCITSGLATTTTTVNATCNTPGSASIAISGGSPPYNIVWNTLPPQFGTSITNVPPGTYTVSVTDASCMHHASLDTVTILPGTGAFLSVPLITTGCPGVAGNNGAITITNTGGVSPFSYTWSNGASATSNSITNLAIGTYSVTVTDNAGCTNLFPSLIITAPAPINFSVNGSIHCFGDTTSLSILPSNGSPPYTVSWTTPLATGNTIHSTGAGTYSGTITDASGCSIPFSHTWTQPNILSATIAGSFNCNIANSGVITVTATGGTPVYNYNWAGFPALINNTASNLAAGIYSITVTDGNSCSTSVIDTIGAATGITVNSPTICSGQTANLTASGASSYTWSAGATSINGNNPNASASPLITTTYTVTGSVSGCFSTATATVTVNPAPVVTVNSPTICAGQTANLTATGGNSYTWSSGADSTTINTATATPSTTTVFSVTGTGAFGCTSVVNSTVTVNTPPIILVSDANICLGSSATLSINLISTGGSPVSYLWSTGSTSSQITAAPITTSPYYITASNTCGSVIDTSLITVLATPVTLFNGINLSGCKPLCVTFNNSSIDSIGAIWHWDFGDTATSSTRNPIHCYQDAGTYSVYLIATNTNHCADTLSMTNYIQVYPLPTASFTEVYAVADIYQPNIVFINHSTNAVSWFWNFGDSTTINVFNPTHTFPSEGIFPVLLTVTTDHGCVDTTEHFITITHDFTFYAPNTITVNGDGKNDIFLPVGTDWDETTFKLWIFDRWGNKCYYTEDAHKGWDGRVNGASKLSQIDVYVWKVELNDKSQNQHSFLGSVTILK